MSRRNFRSLANVNQMHIGVLLETDEERATQAAKVALTWRNESGKHDIFVWNNVDDSVSSIDAALSLMSRVHEILGSLEGSLKALKTGPTPSPPVAGNIDASRSLEV